MKPIIPQSEFAFRVAKTQESMRAQNLDLLLCYANEAEPQFVRYYSDYWPSFESAGVLIPAKGEPLLLIGPESGTFAADHVQNTQHSQVAGIPRVLRARVSRRQTGYV